MRIVLKATLVVMIVFGLPCNGPLAHASDFRVLFGTPETESEVRFLDSLKRSGHATAVIKSLGASISLPRVLTIQFGTRASAHYDPESATIHFPYDFALKLVGSENGELDEQAEDMAIGVLTFALYHEVSHALFDLLELGPLADEEEAADALAVVLAIEFGQEGSELASASTVLYRRQAALNGKGQSGILDPGMSRQRFRRLMCWIAGSEPGHLSKLATQAGIPAERSKHCPGEYQELRASLLSWLDPHLIR